MIAQIAKSSPFTAFSLPSLLVQSIPNTWKLSSQPARRSLLQNCTYCTFTCTGTHYLYLYHGIVTGILSSRVLVRLTVENFSSDLRLHLCFFGISGTRPRTEVHRGFLESSTYRLQSQFCHRANVQ